MRIYRWEFEPLSHLGPRQDVGAFFRDAAKNDSHNGPAVYVETLDRRVPRLRGASSIAYVGQTKRGLAARYGGSGRSINAPENLRIYRILLLRYEGMSLGRFKCRSAEHARRIEGQILARYLRDHCELPPLNDRKGHRTQEEYVAMLR